MKPALLVVDVQKKFFGIKPTMTQSLDDAIVLINAAIKAFREKGLPVICVQHMNEKEGLAPGEEEFDSPEKLDILPSDVHIHKTYGNSFNKTSLEEELRGLGVDTVIVTGFCAEYCVLSTYRGALDRDLTPIIPARLTGQRQAEKHKVCGKHQRRHLHRGTEENARE